MHYKKNFYLSDQSDQSVASSRQTQAEQSVSIASSQASTSSNTVTTTQTAPGLKRPRDGSAPGEEGDSSKAVPPVNIFSLVF